MNIFRMNKNFNGDPRRNRSLVFNEMYYGKTSMLTYMVNVNTYNKGYYLTIHLSKQCDFHRPNKMLCSFEVNNHLGKT